LVESRIVTPRDCQGIPVNRIILSAAVVFAVATAAHADEASDIQAQSKELREQNRALTQRIADLERRQRKLEAQRAKPPATAAGAASPVDSMAAGLAYKAEHRKTPADDSLTWHGITLYGLVDMGVTYQNHGAPLSNAAPLGLNYLISKNSNGSYFGVGPNALGSSFIGLKGNQEIADGLSAVFNLQTGFNPQSGKLSDGLGSIVQNNGLAIGQQNSFADSSKNGQAFNVAANAGLSSPIYGTLTYGRQSALTSDGVVNYDPMGNSGAFSLIGFQGATGGAGDTENRIFDNSFKYAVNVGPFRAAVETQIRSGTFSAPGNAVEAQIGADYAGLSVDAIVSRVTDAVSAAPLSTAQITSAAALGINQGAGLVSGTVSDNTSVMLLARYTIGPVKLFAGYEHMQFANPNNPLTPGSFIPGGYSLGAVNNTNFTTDKILEVFWGGVKYGVRPDLDLSVAYYHEDQNSFQSGAVNVGGACTTSAFAQCSGQLNAASFVADYRFAKRFDAYAGIMWSQVSNGLANGFLQRSSIDPTIGLRFQF
jgi:predicted porin